MIHYGIDNPPVIIIGMHRSGTSLLSRLLEECGVYFGYVKDEYNESIVFQLINEHLLRHGETTWDQPEKFSPICAHSIQLEQMTNHIETLLDESTARYYWGKHDFQTLKNDKSAFQLPWGWKDPRTTITLPAWLRLFPESKVIHIIRNGIDVAFSLNRREIIRLQGKDPHYSKRCQTLAGCFSLWESYVGMGKRFCQHANNSMEILYEDLLGEPEKTLQTILPFLQLSWDQRLHTPMTKINTERRFAYKKNASLKTFAEETKKSKLMNNLYKNIL